MNYNPQSFLSEKQNFQNRTNLRRNEIEEEKSNPNYANQNNASTNVERINVRPYNLNEIKNYEANKYGVFNAIKNNRISNVILNEIPKEIKVGNITQNLLQEITKVDANIIPSENRKINNPFNPTNTENNHEFGNNYPIEISRVIFNRINYKMIDLILWRIIIFHIYMTIRIGTCLNK